MRCKPFTFKKTVKTTKEFKAVSLDLTLEEARILRNLMRFANWNKVYRETTDKVDALLSEHLSDYPFSGINE